MALPNARDYTHRILSLAYRIKYFRDALLAGGGWQCCDNKQGVTTLEVETFFADIDKFQTDVQKDHTLKAVLPALNYCLHRIVSSWLPHFSLPHSGPFPKETVLAVYKINKEYIHFMLDTFKSYELPTG